MNETAQPEGTTADLAGRRWSFGPAVLDERSLELQVDGVYVELERKPLEVLLYLLHHAGEVVTKDDLVENLWPGRILTDTVLSRCISQLRQVLKDDRRTLIRTVHGFGYRLVGQVKVEASADPSIPAFDFKAGDSPPLRPQWKLVERLGGGGHGEAWLARHEKTGDARVFKFAVDPCALSSLKREITLYRLLHDSLGARAAIVRILEWNLQEVPYFIEMEYVPGGNLQSWADAQGGLS
ncbi:MAG: winged helix-turn-helix domain-containing protein, partial [Gammaproteobacteria bacterium]